MLGRLNRASRDKSNSLNSIIASLAPPSFSYEVDYHFYDRNSNLLPMAVPLDVFGNSVPAYVRHATTGFGVGGPDMIFVAPSELYSHVQWRVTIPHQTQTNQNSMGWNLRVYEVP